MFDSERDLGNPLGEGLPKGKQRVRRHWKPSLGRFIHMYSRKGEHAQLKENGDGAEDGSTAPGVPARRHRRLLLAGGAIAVVVTVVAVFFLVGRGSNAISYEILAAREPTIVKINCGSATKVVLGTPQEREQCVTDAAKSIQSADRAHPDRLIVLELQSPPISFSSLTQAQQKELRRELGASAVVRYESAVAGFLERVVDSAARGRVSVLGLPVEPREAGVDGSGRTNSCYGGVMDRIDCLVSAHVFYRGDTSHAEEELIQQILPEAIRRRGDRPVVFRQNTTWRVLVDRGSPRADQLASRRLVVAASD